MSGHRDSKRHERLGISLMFIHLETFEFFKVSASLVHITGKKAADIAHNTLNVLKVYIITQQDLFRPVNDTTASALLAGRLIVGCNDPGTCGMHKCESITKHAMEQVTRKCNKLVVESFPERRCSDQKSGSLHHLYGHGTEIKI